MTNRPLARRANPSHPYIYRSKMMMAGGEFLVGTLSSLQNNPEGRAWIIAGLWKATMPSSKVNTTSATATSGNTTGKNTSVSSSGKFASMFNTVIVIGSALHKHSIHNATITSIKSLK
jgi:hypothetical protein